jgi:ceramide glucosyltransferase
MIFVILLTVCTAFTLLSIVSVLWITRKSRRRTASARPVPVSVLKPLCGADDSLHENLETFFRQDYPDYELIFGVQGVDDPAIAVVRKLKAEYPQVRCRLVIHNGGRGINPKVSNLRAMLEAGSHDVVVISDSNVRVEPGYLTEMAARLSEDNVGLVTSLVAGVGERSLGATMENLHLNGPIAGCVAASQVVGDNTLVVGKSVMFRRSVFERLGGFASVANILAEDYVMGLMFRSAGYRVRLCQTPVKNVCQKTGVKSFMRRYVRWGLMRSRMKALLYPVEPLSNPMAIVLMAPLFGMANNLVILWAVVMTLLRDGIQTARLRGTGRLAYALPLGMLKDLLMLAAWAMAPFVRHISWRGNRVRVSAGTRLYTSAPMSRPEPPLHEGWLRSPD